MTFIIGIAIGIVFALFWGNYNFNLGYTTLYKHIEDLALKNQILFLGGRMYRTKECTVNDLLEEKSDD